VCRIVEGWSVGYGNRVIRCGHQTNHTVLGIDRMKTVIMAMQGERDLADHKQQ